MNITREDMREVAEEAAEKAVCRMLLSLGVDANDPKAIIRFQADLLMLKRWGEAQNVVRTTGIKTLIGVLVTGTLALVWMGLRAKLGLPPIP